MKIFQTASGRSQPGTPGICRRKTPSVRDGCFQICQFYMGPTHKLPDGHDSRMFFRNPSGNQNIPCRCNRYTICILFLYLPYPFFTTAINPNCAMTLLLILFFVSIFYRFKLTNYYNISTDCCREFLSYIISFTQIFSKVVRKQKIQGVSLRN